MRSGFALVALLSLGCGESQDAQQGGKKGKALEPRGWTVDYAYNAVTVEVFCWEGDTVEATAPPASSTPCRDGKARFKFVMKETPAVANIEVTVKPAKGDPIVLSQPVIASPKNEEWLDSLYVVGAVDGEAASPGVTVGGDGIAYGPATAAAGKVRLQIAGPAGSTLSVGGKEVAFAGAEKTVKGVVELDYVAVGDLMVEGLAVRPPTLPRQTSELHRPDGSVKKGTLGGALSLGDAVAGAAGKPIWFVTPGVKPTRNGLIHLVDTKLAPIPVGSGKLSTLGVVVLASPGPSRTLPPCKYPKKVIVARSGLDVVAVAYNPRTGKQVGKRVVRAKAPACPKKPGQPVVPGKTFASAAEIDSASLGKWALTMVRK